MTTPTITNDRECTCLHNIDSNGRDSKCPLHKREEPKLDLKTVREMRDQLVSCQVKPVGNQGIFFMVTTKGNVRRVLKALGFTQKEIRAIMKRCAKVK